MTDNNFWTDERVSEFVGTLLDKYHKGHTFKSALDEFKQSHSVDKNGYEIISYKYPGCDHVIKKEDVIAIVDGYPIYSVRRLSDKTEWTVKETFKYGSKRYVINSFEIEGDKMRVWLGEYKRDSYVYLEKGDTVNFHQMQKLPTPEVKPVLFTDHLGKNVREGEPFFAVQKGTFDLLRNCFHPMTKPDNWTTFKYEEDANEFRLMNKPCLSVNDVFDTLKLFENLLKDYGPKIKQLAQSKLKGGI